jgi:hypothetical protein
VIARYHDAQLIEVLQRHEEWQVERPHYSQERVKQVARQKEELDLEIVVLSYVHDVDDEEQSSVAKHSEENSTEPSSLV